MTPPLPAKSAGAHLRDLSAIRRAWVDAFKTAFRVVIDGMFDAGSKR